MQDTYNSEEPHFGFSLHNDNINTNKFQEYFHKNKPGLNGGIQILTDVILLSKTNIFIKSFSNVSDFVFIFNPDIEII